MRWIVVVGLIAGSLALSGCCARYLFWRSLAEGQPVYRALEGQVVKPMVVSRLEAAWIAFATPDPSEPRLAFYLLRFAAPLAGLLTLALLPDRRPSPPPAGRG